MNIETKWLEDFLALADSRSFSRAAEERHLTQPGLSRRIRALENALDRQLIDRRHNPVQLTAEGELFEGTARNLMVQLEGSIRQLRELRYQQPETLEFAVPQTLSLSLFPQFLQQMQQQLGQLPVRQLVTNVDDCVRSFQNGLSHFLMAFSDNGIDTEQFPALIMQREKMIPVSLKEPNGKPRFPLNSDAGQLPYLAYQPDTYLGRRVSSLLKHPPSDLILQPVFESAMADSLKSMALQGAGVAWVPEFSVRDELQRGTLVRAGGQQWDLILEICLYRPATPLKPVGEKVWQYLQQHSLQGDQ